MTEEIVMTFMERDLTYIDLGIPGLVNSCGELLEQFAVEAISPLSTKLDKLQYPCPTHPRQYHRKFIAGKGRCMRPVAFRKRSQKGSDFDLRRCRGNPSKRKKYIIFSEAKQQDAGTGLGLALAMQLAASMDTDLELLNSNDKGSTFCLSLQQNP